MILNDSKSFLSQRYVAGSLATQVDGRRFFGDSYIVRITTIVTTIRLWGCFSNDALRPYMPRFRECEMRQVELSLGEAAPGRSVLLTRCVW